MGPPTGSHKPLCPYSAPLGPQSRPRSSPSRWRIIFWEVTACFMHWPCALSQHSGLLHASHPRRGDPRNKWSSTAWDWWTLPLLQQLDKCRMYKFLDLRKVCGRGWGYPSNLECFHMKNLICQHGDHGVIFTFESLQLDL